jgi:hypothetical protein
MIAALATLDNWRVSWALVQRSDAGELVVDRPALALHDGKLRLDAPPSAPMMANR